MNNFKKLVAVLLACAMTLTLMLAIAIPSSAVDYWNGTDIATGYAGGTGTEADPFKISTAAQLAFLATEAEFSASSEKFYVLTGDINLGDFPWNPIGTTKDLPFKGTFDGQGYTISGLTCIIEDVSSSTYAGLFGGISGATIKNLTVSGTKVMAKYAGAIVGYSVNGSRIVNCTSKLDCIDGVTIGGIAGRMQDAGAEILFCTNETPIKPLVGSAASGDHFMGGIVGAGGGLTISYCANKADITCDIEGTPAASHYHVGGIIGVHGASSSPVDVKYCYNLGNISGYDTLSAKGGNYISAGGIVGRGGHVANGSVTGCYSIGNVTWTTEKGADVQAERAGGVVGMVTKSFTLSDCYSTMEVLVGKNDQMIDVSTVKTLTLAEMQGANALKNMNLGSSIDSVLSSEVSKVVSNLNYKASEIEAFTNYTDGKTLDEYAVAKVREQLSLTAGADIWVTADGKTPELGSLEAINAVADVTANAAALAEAVFAELHEKYKNDPANTTAEDTTEETPADTTEPVQQTTTAGDQNTTAAPNNDTTTAAPEEGGCGGFVGFAAIFVAVVASLSCAIIIKKN